MNRLTLGIDRIVADPDQLGTAPTGLITSVTGLTHDLEPNIDALQRSGVQLAALLGPEHGVRGTGQAGDAEADDANPWGLPVVDTYHLSGPDLDARIAAAGVEQLVFDIQDVGVRFYTFTWTMFDCLESAARLGIPFVVLDRPNPLGGLVSQGPTLDPAYSSFVGRVPIPTRHGLTVGELAQHFNATSIPERAGRPASLRVIEVIGWQRDTYGDIGMPWVPPSPNLPTLDSAAVYPGTCLFEGTNLSEGRGTTRPFETIGAPYVDGRFAALLRARGLPGIAVRDTWFVPTFSKHAGATCRGVALHITDHAALQPIQTALVMLQSLAELYPDDFGWGERSIDLLWGSDTLRQAHAAGTDLTSLVEPVQHPREWAADALLYGDAS